MYKRQGISTPLVVHWPARIKDGGRLRHQPGHLIDIMATCLDLAGFEYPESYRGEPVGPPRGRSLVPILAGKERAPPDRLFFTFYGTHNALRSGDWKLVNKDAGPWELYNVAEDRTELDDRARAEPERLGQMKAQWDELASGMGVSAKPRGGQKKPKKKVR